MLLESTSLGILMLGLSLGVVHAFDADHIMAVTSLANRKNPGKIVRYAVRWALGHGGILVLIAVLLMVFNIQLPASWVSTAEKSVGIILILAGLSILWSVKQDRLTLQLHKHDNHQHIHLVEAPTADHDHTPVMVGAIHGIAGSAPLLAIIPTTMHDSSLGLIYVLVFSLGVLSGMLGFGFTLGRLQQKMCDLWPAFYAYGRLLIACMALVIGAHWLTT